MGGDQSISAPIGVAAERWPVTEDIMDQMRRWQLGCAVAPLVRPSEVMPFGDWLVWTICRGPELVNTVTRYPDMEF